MPPISFDLQVMLTGCPLKERHDGEGMSTSIGTSTPLQNYQNTGKRLTRPSVDGWHKSVNSVLSGTDFSGTSLNTLQNEMDNS